MLDIIQVEMHMQKLKNAKWKTLALFLFVGLGLIAANLEGYLEMILGSAKFMIFFAAVFIGCIITALYQGGKTKFFIWLLVFGFFIGLITQMVGTTNGLWIYKDSFLFIGFSWAFATIAMLGLSLVVKKYFPEVNSKLYNVFALIVLVLIILVFLGDFRTKVSINFWIYYIALFVFAAVTTYHLKSSTLFSIILAAWVIGFISEYMGSSAGLWNFCAVSEGSEMVKTIACWTPPPYLTFGCWPLEFITQIGLCSFISQQNIPGKQ